MDNTTFRKRSGTTSRGKEFEDLVVANLILKLLQDNNLKNFQLSSNDDEYGAFDDVVLETETKQGLQQIQALQLKHVNKEKNLTKNGLKGNRGNFSITKYFEDFCKLTTSHTKVQFVLFTNLKFEAVDGEKIHLDDDNSEVTVIQAQFDPLLNTTPEGRCYRFESTNEKYVEFFGSFFLYTNQANVDKMKTQVAYRFENLFSCGGFTFKEFLDFVSNWNIKEGKKSKLHLTMIKRVLVFCMLLQQIVPYSFENSSDDSKSELLKEAFSRFRVITFKMDNREKIRKVYSGTQKDFSADETILKVGLKYQLISKHEDLINLNDIDKTKLLWLLGMYPLIVVEDYAVRKVVSFCQEGKFAILTNRDGKENCRFLSDLKRAPKICDKILETFSCSIQGKTKLTLSDLVTTNEEFETIITADELLEMMEGTFVIGGPAEELPVPYISRHISVNTIDYKFLDEMEDDTLVVITCGDQFDRIKEHLSQCQIRKIHLSENGWICSAAEDLWTKHLSLSDTRAQTIFVNENDSSTNLLKTLCKKNPLKRKYHHFKVVSGKLSWVESVCTTEDLEKYCLSDDFIPEAEFIANRENKIELICADPGMGKSVLMRRMKSQQPSNYWTVLISSKEYSSYFKDGTCNAAIFIQYILQRENRFESKFLEILIQNRQVIFIWDGLDEIPLKKLEIVINIILEISQKEFYQFLTSRCNLKKLLEHRLNVLARTIKPFDKSQQSNYIMNKLNLKEGDDIVKKITRSIEVLRCHDVLGVPLHVYMLTELFLRNPDKYTTILNNELFSIADLYYYFVDEKFNIYYKEKAKLDDSDDAVRELISDCKRDRLDNYEFVSLNMIFKERRKLHNSFLEDIRKNNDCVGIIANVTSEGVPIFIHHSFGDYFIASYLVKHYKQEKYLLDSLFTQKYKTIRFFFDLILAQDCPAHIAVLYQNSELVMSYGEPLHKTDKGGRNPLLLACSWGMRYYPFKYQKVGLFSIEYNKKQICAKREPKENTQILQFLTLYCIPYQIDHIFQMDAFEYANRSSSFYPMLLLTKTYKRYLLSFSNFKDVAGIFFHSVKLDYTEIFDIPGLKPWIVQRVEWMVQTSLRWNSLHTLEKLLFDKNYNKKIDNSTLPIHIACRYRNIDVLQLLIRTKIDLNTPNVSGFTPLGIACQQGHLDVVKLLVAHGAKINCTNSRTPPLALACYGGHISTVKFLLDSGADIHLRGKSDITCLHFASFFDNVSIAKLLVDGGFDINATCKITYKGVTSLLIASGNGRSKMVGFLLDNGADVNLTAENGLTPLYLASERGFSEITRMLIAAGADVNALTTLGGSALYRACYQGHVEVVRMLIAVGADINVLTIRGVSALHGACSKGHVEVVRILLDAGADINCKNARRCTPLYLACEYRRMEIVKILLGAGADISVRNLFGRNALQVARNKGYSEIVQLFSSRE